MGWALSSSLASLMGPSKCPTSVGNLGPILLLQCLPGRRQLSQVDKSLRPINLFVVISSACTLTSGNCCFVSTNSALQKIVPLTLQQLWSGDSATFKRRGKNRNNFATSLQFYMDPARIAAHSSSQPVPEKIRRIFRLHWFC